MTAEGLCQVCGKWITLRQDGTVRGHGATDLYDNWCQGALLPPVVTRARGARGNFDFEDTGEL